MSLQYIFFWRLEKEKGADLVLKLPKYFPNIKIRVFWYGSLESQFRKFFNTQDLKFFGWKEQRFIKEYLKKADISLMPSRFLETFWLSALESVSYWVPVIWFNKWGLKQFLHPDLSIHTEKDFFKVIEKLEKWYINLDEIKKYTKNIALQYTKEKFVEKLKEFLPKNTRKIIIISDYLYPIGWIERYIISLKDILSSIWIQAILFGYKNKVNYFKKIFLLWQSYFNSKPVKDLQYLIDKEKPDIIWYHSISRYLWPNILGIKFNWIKLMTYHDLWYFAPFASKVYNLDDLVLPWSLKNYLKILLKQSYNPFEIIYGISKYYKLNNLRKKLISNIDIHIIPSNFMQQILQKRWIKKNIFILQHFFNM